MFTKLLTECFVGDHTFDKLVSRSTPFVTEYFTMELCRCSLESVVRETNTLSTRAP